MDVNNVQEIGSNKDNDKNKGSVFVVDPNPPGMDIVPPEDLFIYVKFSAYPRSRTTYGGNTLAGDPIIFNSGVADEVNFISTKISYNGDGKIDPSSQKTYATTEWTQIGGLNNSETRSAGILEGFGIKSIDIKYNASLVPVVDITFTDVRGGALFDVIEDNDRLSPYSIFFKMPYPVFRLSVKGYFGQKVDYCLHMVNWTSNFDGSTGNFDISANFLGFQQAFLNDMVMGNIIGVVNTEQGFANLNRIFDERIQRRTGDAGNGVITQDGLNIRKIDDFMTKIGKLQVETEVIKTDSNSFQFLKDLNGKLNILKTIQTFIGKSLTKEPNNNNEGSVENNVTDSKPFIQLENNKNVIETTTIKDDELKVKNNYFSIRDYIVFNSVNRGAFKSYITTLSDIIEKYQKYLSSDKRTEYKPTNTVTEAKEKNQKKTEKISGNENKANAKDQELINSFPNILNENAWEDYIVPPTKNTDGKISAKKYEDILDLFYFSGGTNNLNLRNSYDGDTSGKYISFNMDLFKKLVTDGVFYSQTMTKNSQVLVADFRKQRELVEYSIIELEEIIKVQREVVQSEINEQLLKNFKDKFGFKPTIDNCFEIIANNTQAMIETIYDISSESEQKSKASSRGSLLSRYDTDIPTGINSAAWPSVYQKNNDGSSEEIYIGDVSGINPNDFPEWKFTEEVFEILVSKRKTLEEVTKASTLKNGLDTDNWFPINPIDYKTNPWLKINLLNDINSIKEELVEKFVTRSVLLDNYSLFGKGTGLDSISDYSKLEAIAANRTIYSKTVREIIINLLDEMNRDSTVYENTNYWKNNVTIDSNNLVVLNEQNSLPKIDGFKISGAFSPEAEYILFDVNDIINNSKNLFKEIREDSLYGNLIDEKSANGINSIVKGPSFYKNFYSKSNNLTTYNSFNVWDLDVCKNLLKTSGDILGDLNKTNLEDYNPYGGTYNSKYINITNLETTNSVDYDDLMTDSDLYKNQSSNYARALLLLSTFPFRDFKEGFLNSIFPGDNFNGARIINIPKMYIYFIGGLLWRYESSIDPINFGVFNNKDYSQFATPKEEYFSKVGYNNKKKSIEENLKKLPISTKTTLINLFKNWVDNQNFNNTFNGTFEKNVNTLVSPLNSISGNTNDVNSSKEFILSALKQTTNMIVLNPRIFYDKLEPSALKISNNSIAEYIKSFKDSFKKQEETNKNGNSSNSEEVKQSENKSTVKLKLQLYNYFKNINSKWVGSDRKGFNICGGNSETPLIDYFRFIDRGWNDIGDKATFNLKSFLTLGSNLDTSVYFFMSKLLRDSNFLFQILPTYINYKSRVEVAKIFKPQTTLEGSESQGPIFCCIYIGGASQALDIKERNNNFFSNDGYSFSNPNDPNSKNDAPPDILNNGENSLVAFRVAFGAQNQTIFKNVSLSQQEHRETGEYFKALSDLVDKRGGTQKTYVGTDLLRLFKTRSYSCKVESLGCMNIQPLMYFDLQNVPFFNGAYLITSVSHNISPNHMTTNFEGLRQSKFIAPPNTEITADLDIDLNEISDVPKIEFTNLQTVSGFGVREGITPDDLFDFEGNFGGVTGLSNFRNLGVTTYTDADLTKVLNTLTDEFKKNQILTNTQVTMLLSAMLANSENFVNKEMPWDDPNKEEHVVKFPNTDPASGQTRYYIYKPGDGALSSTPTSVSGLDIAKAYQIAGNEKLNEFQLNDNIESKLKDKIKERDGLNPNDPANANKIASLNKIIDNLNEEDKNQITTTKYFNIFDGDAYRFRPRGFLYIVGRKQYYQIYEDFNKGGEVAIQSPYELSNTVEGAIQASIAQWKFYKGKDVNSPFFYTSQKNNGTLATYKKCIDTAHQWSPPTVDKSIETLQNVLTIFIGKDKQPLIDYFKPA
jgi:hypothetical protein